MDTNILVNDLIEEGRRIVEQLPQNGFEVTAAFWLKAAEDEEWYFYIVSPLVESERLDGAYGRLHALIRRMPPPLWISPLEMKLIAPSNPIAKDVLAIHKSALGPQDRPMRWHGNQLGNVRVDGAYLYPLPATASS